MSLEKIVFAGGCFWGVERYFQAIKGVENTVVGYANSKNPNPSYEQVCTGITNAAEAVEVTFNSDVISLKELLDHFFKIIDPFSLNRQGNDVGTQYRTGIYYTSQREVPIILDVLKQIVDRSGRKVQVEVLPLANFYPAEEYHQDYLLKNPYGYCHIPIPQTQEGSYLDKKMK